MLKTKKSNKVLCLVTGGAGFIGSHLVDGLLKKGYRVRILDNFSTGREANLGQVRSRIEIIRGDMRVERDLQRAVQDVTYVFHLAAIASVPESVARPLETHDINVTGTFKLLMASQKAGVRRFIFTSSAAVYGETKKSQTTEEEPLCPESPYAASKIMGEYYCRNFFKLYGLETVALRYFNVYGPRQNPRSKYANVIPIFLQCLLKGTPPEVHWDGKQSRDFVYVEDVVAANLLAMKQRDACGGIFNIGTHTEVSVLDCLRGLQEILGIRKIKILHRSKRAGDVRRTFADIRKAQRLLGYRPSVPFPQGLRWTTEWFMRNREFL